jgi:hypothetical protein
MNKLISDIKHNCNVSDAVYWGYFSICGLLMRYRDLYRSEHDLDPWATIPMDRIASWIEQKESRWPELENEVFRTLEIDGDQVAPFDSDAANSSLNRAGLAYGAGYGAFLKPTFVLAEISSVAEIEGHRVYTTDREIVRDLFTAPAMLQGLTIFLRRQPQRELLWDLYTQLHPGCAPLMTESFRLHGLEPGRPGGPGMAEPLERMAEAFSGVLLRHEIAESREALPVWKDLLAVGLDRRAELFLRAVQDLVADASAHGPLRRCVEDRDRRGLFLTVGLMERFRSSLVPELRDACRRFRETGDWTSIEAVRAALFERFRNIRREVVDLYDPADPPSFNARISALSRTMAERRL